ncbi:MAG: biotin/lipoyl-containing protein, partial [Micromonosporaceae bacterium]
MAVSVTMPQLGESVTEGTITRWLKQEGDRVEADEPLLEVSTDKVDTEIPSPASGVLSRIVVPEDETADVGAELAVIDGQSGGSTPSQPPEQAEAEEQPAEEAPATQPEAAEPAPQPSAEDSAAGGGVPQQQPQTTDVAGGSEVTMPALGESVTEGTITRWLKQVGDQVEVDEPLLEVSTDKVDTEIPSPAAGKLLEIRVAEDDTAEVGATLAVISGGAAAEAPAAAPEPAAPAEQRPAVRPAPRASEAQVEAPAPS